MTLDSWTEYTGSRWLKSEDVDSEDRAFVVVGIGLDDDDQRPVLELEANSTSYKFSLNVTNATKCSDHVASPKELVGKKLYFKKVLVRNPSTNKETEGLRIYNIVD